jgi:hypothetical protein
MQRQHPAQWRGDTILSDLPDDVSISGHVFLRVYLSRGQILVAEDQLSGLSTELAANLCPSVVP